MLKFYYTLLLKTRGYDIKGIKNGFVVGKKTNDDTYVFWYIYKKIFLVYFNQVDSKERALFMYRVLLSI